MKNIFSFLAALFFSVAAFAQIPNAGFEAWTGSLLGEKPTSWWTLNELAPLGFVQKDTVANSGASAARIKPVFVQQVGDTLGSWLSLNSMYTDTTFNGISYAGRPDSVKFYFKTSLVNADTLYFSAQLSRWDTDSNKTINLTQPYYFYVPQNVPTFNFVKFPVIYDGAFSGNSDSLQIYFFVGKFSSETGSPSSFAVIDDVELIGGTTVKVQDLIIANSVNIYPNPSNGSFNVEIPAVLDNSVLSVYDITGKEVFTKNVSSGLLNLNTNSASGKYFVKIQNGKHSVSKSIVVE
jgi:hypothetical protein